MRHPRRRLVAFALDQLVVGLWIGALTLASWSMRRADWLGEPEPVATLAAKLAGHALSLLVLTLPVLLYFSLFEAWRGATPGKRALGLRVLAVDGGRLPLGRALLRNAIKLAPWELSHVAVWYVPGRPFVDPPAAWNVAAWSVSLSFVVVWIVALFRSGRTPYDRAAGAEVVRLDDVRRIEAAEDQEDLAAFEERRSEPDLPFDEVVRGFDRR